MGFWNSRFRTFTDQPHHVGITHAKDRAVDHEERQQTDAHMQIAMGRYRIFSAHQAMYNPRLAADFGGYPTG